MSKWVLIFFLFLYPLSYSQPPDTTITIYGKGIRGPYSLGHRNLILNLVNVYRDTVPLSADSFAVEYNEGLIHLANPLPIGDSLKIKFAFMPFDLSSEYYLHRFHPVQKESTATTDLFPIKSVDDNSNLSIVGSKGFSIQTGQGQNGLSQSLNLTITGSLVPGLRTSAHISDKSQGKSGVSRRLDELDKIYIEAESDNFKGTFGDFDYVSSGDPLMNFQRKLTGLNAFYNKNGNNVRAAAAFFPGEYSSVTINGRDGLLGPYYLTDIGGRTGALILPGSERVYIDGLLQQRGSQNDYTIDYEAGSVQFTPAKVIRNETRITIDYEISREEYGRGFYTASGDAAPANGLRIYSSILQEGDNKNSPKSFELTDETRSILENAGADRLSAYRSGVQNVGPNLGDYNLQADSLGNIYYVYVGPNHGAYNVSFSFIQVGKGSYKPLGGGAFSYVGPGLGDYEPVILIPLPQMKRYGSVGSSWISGDSSISFEGEFAGSLYDRNMLSSRDNIQKGATAFGTAGFTRNLFDSDVFFAIKAHARKIERDAVFPGRIDNVERYRQYDLDPNSDVSGEKVEEIALSGGPDKARIISYEFGYLTRYDIKSRYRHTGALDWKLAGPITAFSNIERTSGNRIWWKNSAGIRGNFARLQPILRVNYEKRDGLTGFKYYEYVTSVPVKYASNISGQSDVTFRDEKYLDAGWRNKFQSGSIQQKIDFVAGQTGFSGQLAGSYYKKHYRDGSGANVEQKTGSTQLAYSDPGGRGGISVNERLSSSNQRLQAKNYIFVGEGKGDYKFRDGEYIRDPQGDYIVIIEEVGEGSKITEISSELNGSVSPFVMLDNSHGLENKIGRFNIESNLVYGLRKSSDALIGRDFVPWRNTRSANIVLQNGQFDTKFFYYPPSSRHRIRYDLSRSFENGSPFANETSDNYTRSDELSWAFPASRKIDVFLSGLISNSRHNLNGIGYIIDRRHGEGSANYRFHEFWTITIGSSYEIAHQTDTGLRANLPSGNIGLTRDFSGNHGRISGKFTYTRMNVSPAGIYVPFQVAQGKGAGNNFEGLLNARLSVTRNGRIDFSYRYQHFVRRPEDHNLRLEFTVLFL